jgi:hypothetical protein
MRDNGESIVEAEKQCITIGFAVPDHLCGQERAATRPILHNHRSIPLGGKTSGENARHNVDRGSRIERHDESHRSGRPSLGQRSAYSTVKHRNHGQNAEDSQTLASLGMQSRVH